MIGNCSIRFGETNGEPTVAVDQSNQELSEPVRSLVRQATGGRVERADGVPATAHGNGRATIDSPLTGVEDAVHARLDETGVVGCAVDR